MKYRKKPIIIEAIQFRKDNWKEIYNFLQNKDGNMCKYALSPEGRLEIKTLEGLMTGEINDWIIKGVKGEFYPCKPDIFEQTYEPIEET